MMSSHNVKRKGGCGPLYFFDQPTGRTKTTRLKISHFKEEVQEEDIADNNLQVVSDSDEVMSNEVSSQRQSAESCVAGKPDTSPLNIKDHDPIGAYKRAAHRLLQELAHVLVQRKWSEEACIPQGIVNIWHLTAGGEDLISPEWTSKGPTSNVSLKFDKAPIQVSDDIEKEIKERNFFLENDDPAQRKPHVQSKPNSSRAHTSISLSILCSSSKQQGWTIQPAQLVREEPQQLTLCQWVVQRLQAARRLQKLQTAEQAKQGLNKPTILRYYGDYKTWVKDKTLRSKVQPATLVNDLPCILEVEQQHPARHKLHYRLSDGSSFVYYPSGCLAVCQSRSGLSCGGFYTNVFSDGKCPVVLATITAFGHGAVTDPLSSAITAVWDQDGGFLNDCCGNVTKEWSWRTDGLRRKKIVLQVSDLISVQLLNGTAALLTFNSANEIVSIHLSAITKMTQTKEMMVKEMDGLDEWRRGGVAGRELKRLQQRARRILCNWLNYYHVAIGIKCPNIKQMPGVPLRSRLRRTVQSAALPSLNPLNQAEPAQAHQEESKKEEEKQPRNLSSQAESHLDSCMNLPRTPENQRKDEPQITRIGPLKIHGNINLGSVIIPKIPELQTPIVASCPTQWSLDTSAPVTVCPALLRAALLGEVGRRRCCCSSTLMPLVTDLEYDAFLMGQPLYSQQILVVCVAPQRQPLDTQEVSDQEVLEQLYRRRNKRRTMPCIQVLMLSYEQGQMDSFRLVGYEMSTKTSCEGQSSLLQRRHNAAPGMVLFLVANSRQKQQLGEADMNSVVQKPPVAPKPMLVLPQRPGMSPSTPRNHLPQVSPATTKKVKPPVAPKPRLARVTGSVESKPLNLKSPHQVSVTENSQTIVILQVKNGIQQDNKKPDCDHVIPICLCSQEECMPTKSTANVDKTEKMQCKGKNEANRTPHPKSSCYLNKNRQEMDNKCHVTNCNPEQNYRTRLSNNNHLINHDALQEMLTVGKNVNTNTHTSSPTRSPVCHRAWSDEENGSVSVQEEPFGLAQMPFVSKPNPVLATSKKPVVVPRKPRKAALVPQKKVEEREEINQEGRELKVKEMTVSSERKNNSSPSVSVPVPVMNKPVGEIKRPFFVSARKSCAPLMVQGGQMPDHTGHDTEMCPDKGQDGPQNIKEYVRTEHKFSCPLTGIEQNENGDEFCSEMEEPYYVNFPLYDISHYMNQPLGNQASMYDAEDIHEEQPVPLEREAGHPQKHCGDERGTVDEDPTLQDIEPFDDDDYDDFDDFMGYSFEEDDDQSSTSSKGDPGQPEEMVARSGLKNRIRHIATEIMTSERVFVDVLKLLHVDFRDAVSKASQNGKPVIEEQLLNQILYYLPHLYELNQDLLRELEQRVDRWEENPQVADIFLKKGHYLKMYSTYIRELDKNVALLEEQSKKNSAFGAVVKEFEASPRCANLALNHYLLKPFQRIPQYQLLLTNYLKNLSVDSKDYNDTQAALDIVKEVASHANDIMKHGDNYQKLIQVQCRLSGQHEILKPSRIFLKEGILMKLSRKIMQPRMFFLFNDTLLCTTPVQSGQYKLNNMLSLAGMKVSKPNQEAYQNELNIESVERSFILSASSAAERDDWLLAISTAISDYTRKEISFISGNPPQELEMDRSGALLGSKAPIWIPDVRVTMCMMCTCEFTVTWRRHHCRACGKVVCHSCSSNKHRLEYLKNQRARVCDQCFVILLQQKSKQAQSAAVSPGNSSTAFNRRQKKIPAALKEVSANTDSSSMSGYLQRSKTKRKQGKRLWFVIKDKVLYTYAASEDVVALESQPLLGFKLRVDLHQKLRFNLYHKNILYYIFKADDIQTAERWIDSFKEATVL